VEERRLLIEVAIDPDDSSVASLKNLASNLLAVAEYTEEKMRSGKALFEVNKNYMQKKKDLGSMSKQDNQRRL
jgi:hypothetical protein